MFFILESGEKIPLESATPEQVAKAIALVTKKAVSKISFVKHLRD